MASSSAPVHPYRYLALFLVLLVGVYLLVFLTGDKQAKAQAGYRPAGRHPRHADRAHAGRLQAHPRRAQPGAADHQRPRERSRRVRLRGRDRRRQPGDHRSRQRQQRGPQPGPDRAAVHPPGDRPARFRSRRSSSRSRRPPGQRGRPPVARRPAHPRARRPPARPARLRPRRAAAPRAAEPGHPGAAAASVSAGADAQLRVSPPPATPPAGARRRVARLRRPAAPAPRHPAAGPAPDRRTRARISPQRIKFEKELRQSTDQNAAAAGRAVPGRHAATRRTCSPATTTRTCRW